MEQRRGLLADEVNAARVVNVVDIVPADALRPVFLLHTHTNKELGIILLSEEIFKNFYQITCQQFTPICWKKKTANVHF